MTVERFAAIVALIVLGYCMLLLIELITVAKEINERLRQTHPLARDARTDEARQIDRADEYAARY